MSNESGIVKIDSGDVPKEVYRHKLSGNLALSIKLSEKQHISNANVDGLPVSSYFENKGYAYIYLPPLEKKIYQFNYAMGENIASVFINNSRTYNVYNVIISKDTLKFDLKMYGTQTIKIRC